MSKEKGDVGLVKPKLFEISKVLTLDSGKKFGPVTIVYETYGNLDTNKSNAVLIFHALSGNSHAAGYHSEDDKYKGWWDNMIGPGKAFDTNKYFVICTNVIGGCSGSTGPQSVNPKTKKAYGIDFPILTIRDMVKFQKELIDHIGIKKLFAVTGGSMGGMQALQWAVDYPESVKLVIPIATAAKQSAQNIAFQEVGRRAIVTDPNWNNGDYYGKKLPRHGLSVARMVGHITYLSDASMREKFGRKLQDKEKLAYSLDTEFAVESYLHYKGDSFVERFDANSYLIITKAIDYFDLTEAGKKKLYDVFSMLKSKFLVISYSSDWLYTTNEAKEIVRALQKAGVDVVYFDIESDYGHDSFLLPNDTQTSLIKNFLRNNYDGP